MTTTKDSRNILILLSLTLSAATLLTYWQVQDNDFVNYDDPMYVTENLYVRSGLTGQSVRWAFANVRSGIWHPLTWLSHMWDYELYGSNPKGHHLNNLLLHIANSVMLLFILHKMTGAPLRSALVAALFALHPLHVESVAWISERKDVLSTFFWMLTIWAYAHYVECGKRKWYLPTFLFFAMGLLAKPMLVTLPFVMVLLDYWPLARFKKASEQARIVNLHHGSTGIEAPWPTSCGILFEKIPFFLLSAISAILAFQAQRHAGAMASLHAFPLGARTENVLLSYASYIVKMFWPQDLAIIYPYPEIFPLSQVLGSALLLISLSFFFLAQRQARPFLFIGWFWYLGTLVPVIGLIQIGSQAMADRYTYIPLIGLFIIISWLIPSFSGQRPGFRIGMALLASAVFLSLAIRTSVQLSYWKESTLLFRHTLQVTNNNYLAQKYLGNALVNQGKYKEAIFHLSEALRLKPDFAGARNDLAVALMGQGNPGEAISHLHEALRFQPNYARAHFNLAVILAQQNRFGEAIMHYRETLRIEPNTPEAHNNLGVILASQGSLEEAIDHYSEALRINPDRSMTRRNLNWALRQIQTTSNHQQ